MIKPNCHECKHSRNVPGSAHLACHHPSIMAADGAWKMMALQLFYMTHEFKPLNLTASSYGVAKDWCMWPINFDPVWLNSCDGFEKKEGDAAMNDQAKSDSSSAVSPTNAADATQGS